MPWFAYAQSQVDVYVFWRVGCPHCENAMALLDRLEAQGEPLRQQRFEIGGDARSRELFQRVVIHFNLERPAVPLVVVGDRVFAGYLNDVATGSAYLGAIRDCAARVCIDSVQALTQALSAPAVTPQRSDTATLPTEISLPVIGTIDLRGLSLPVLTILLAAADGFNPCAMWALVFLIGLLAGMRNRRRMWLLGATFLLASAAVYFAFMAAWLNLLLVLGVIVWIRWAIALVALAGGAYALWDAIRHPQPVCAVSAGGGRKRVFDRLKEMVKEPRLPFAMTGIALLAFAVNLIELVCSAGIPAVYTQILTLTPMPPWRYYAYLLLYLFVYMLDDLIVFASAMWTLQVTGLSDKYVRYSRLAGGVLLIALGLMLLLKPELLSYR
jgi:glutaredoxin